MSFLLIVSSILTVIGIMMLGKWLKLKNADAPVKEKNVLHGHDLDVWQYLGFVTLSVDSSTNEVFLFCKKNDHTRRSYAVTGYDSDWTRRNHKYVLKYLDPWKFGEHDIYTFTVDGRSKWLQEYMIEKFGCEWNTEKKWWAPTEDAKFKKAQKKQEAANKKSSDAVVIAETSANVITVDFGGNAGVHSDCSTH